MHGFCLGQTFGFWGVWRGPPRHAQGDRGAGSNQGHRPSETKQKGINYRQTSYICVHTRPLT